eukprot:UN27218
MGKKNGFWPFTKQLDADFEDDLNHMVVEDDFEEEIKKLLKELELKNTEIKKLKAKEKEFSGKMSQEDAEIEKTVDKLGMVEFEIISMNRKIREREDIHGQCLEEVAQKEKTLHSTRIENRRLLSEIQKIDQWHKSGSQRPIGDFEAANSVAESYHPTITEWTVEDVKYWWRVILPDIAQRYIQIVEDCQITGLDLLEFDEKMFSEFDMPKILISKILSKIDELRKDAPHHTRSVVQQSSNVMDDKRDPTHRNDQLDDQVSAMSDESHDVTSKSAMYRRISLNR